MTQWHTVALGTVVTFQRGFDLPHRARRLGNIPIVSSAGVTDFHNCAMVDPPGVVTGRYGTIGELFFVSEPFWPLNTTLYVRDFHGNDPLFVYYHLQRFNFATFSGKSGVPGVNRNDLHAETVTLPIDTGEQRAIAEALSDVDGLLGGLDRIIAKKRDLKQAAMQQLLTGQTRLPGFNSEWRKVKISDLCEYVSGTKTSGGDKGYVEIGDVDVVRKSYSLSQKEKLSVPGAVSVPAGTLLISTVRPTRGAIAITNESCYVSSAFCRLQPINGLLFHLVCQPQFLAYLGENAIGGTYPTCRDETILDYETAVPRDHEEQIAIATLLFDMDAESAALEARRDKIQALKQGMMQELLTGRIRLLQPEALHA